MIVLLVILGLLMLAPQLWVRYVMHKYRHDQPGMQGTGGELAEHLIERFQLSGIGVEKTGEFQDHFDPYDKMVRLSPSNYEGKSLRAIAVAAHEVGHAIQFSRKEKIFRLRSKYLPLARGLQRAAGGVLVVAPVLALITKSPAGLMLPIALSILIHVVGALTYLIVLPEEWDASFGKALPILEEYLPTKDMPAVNSVLRAAALTYFAAALSSIFSIAYLLALLRR